MDLINNSSEVFEKRPNDFAKQAKQIEENYVQSNSDLMNYEF